MLKSLVGSNPTVSAKQGAGHESARRLYYSGNAGITVCDFHPLKRFTASRGWQVISFNEEP